APLTGPLWVLYHLSYNYGVTGRKGESYLFSFLAHQQHKCAVQYYNHVTEKYPHSPYYHFYRAIFASELTKNGNMAEEAFCEAFRSFGLDEKNKEKRHLLSKEEKKDVADLYGAYALFLLHHNKATLCEIQEAFEAAIAMVPHHLINQVNYSSFLLAFSHKKTVPMLRTYSKEYRGLRRSKEIPNKLNQSADEVYPNTPNAILSNAESSREKAIHMLNVILTNITSTNKHPGAAAEAWMLSLLYSLKEPSLCIQHLKQSIAHHGISYGFDATPHLVHYVDRNKPQDIDAEWLYKLSTVISGKNGEDILQDWDMWRSIDPIKTDQMNITEINCTAERKCQCWASTEVPIFDLNDQESHPLVKRPEMMETKSKQKEDESVAQNRSFAVDLPQFIMGSPEGKDKARVAPLTPSTPIKKFSLSSNPSTPVTSPSPKKLSFRTTPTDKENQLNMGAARVYNFIDDIEESPRKKSRVPLKNK
ncbi:hypothetical protein PROFUN_16632, partial [Planoprotostelium fungivorum]